MSDDEFDQLRDRIETLEDDIDRLEAEQAAEGEVLPFADDDPLWVKLTDDNGLVRYAPMSRFEAEGPDAGASNPYSDKRGDGFENKFLNTAGDVNERHQWYFTECDVLTREEVIDEVGL